MSNGMPPPMNAPTLPLGSGGVGLAVSKQEIDARAGAIARAFQKAFQDVTTLSTFLERSTVESLEGLGYTADDVTLLKSAINDLGELAMIWKGSATLAQPKDFRTFVSRLWGVGAF